MPTTPRYLRFVQALALAGIAPACSSAGQPAPTPKSDPTTQAPADPLPSASASSQTPTSEPQPVADAGGDEAPTSPLAMEPDAESVVDAEADSRRTFSSGPIVPPELPTAFRC